MNTVQSLESVLDWLLADPAHVVLAASVIAALVPTPAPGSIAGKLWRVVDVLALNILHAKETGVNRPSPPASPPAQKSAQAGSAASGAALVLCLIGAAFLLSGCSGAQSVFNSVNAGAVQAAMGAGQDEMTLGRELICGTPYQVIANAMANDTNMAGAVPALCPATKSVPVTPPAPAAKPVAGD